MAKKTKRGRKQDRARVAGGQDHEVRYEAKKTGKSKAKVRRAVKKAGPSRKKVERALCRSFPSKDKRGSSRVPKCPAVAQRRQWRLGPPEPFPLLGVGDGWLRSAPFASSTEHFG
jgi:Protein of unknown function (DUF3606)